MTSTNAKNPKHTSRAAKAKRKIMQTAGRLFAERGFGNVGIHEVGQSAGFGKGALYYHIQSKEDLFVSIVTDCLERLISETESAVEGLESVEDRVSALTKMFEFFLVNQPDAMTLSCRDTHTISDPDRLDLVNQLNADYLRIWADTLQCSENSDGYRQATDMELEMFHGMLFASVFWFDVDAQDTAALAGTFSGAILKTLAMRPA